MASNHVEKNSVRRNYHGFHVLRACMSTRREGCGQSACKRPFWVLEADATFGNGSRKKKKEGKSFSQRTASDSDTRLKNSWEKKKKKREKEGGGR